ncbi:MAG: ribosomal protein S18-alanine N-acetyltransferase [Dehalococcoidia bacterium]|nr:ribosomal protein S18-alanine N-acetyltransferase [Dehalococcoidia bacterium]MDW8119256.1 ribosomal protein S18-alanine N-acetyltransferase [Chloroflexota bacterium]
MPPAVMNTPSHTHSSAQALPYILRPMLPQDIPQVEAIEREAFGPWNRTDFHRELRSSYAHHLVACRRDEGTLPPPSPNSFGPKLFLWWSQRRDTRPHPSVVNGYVSTWFLGGDAHIVAIAVATPYRRQGIGELLLMGSIEEAMRRRAQAVTLEVRVSNIPAQRLYEKYGFVVVGRRRGYYLDNGEDALIMTLPDPCGPAYRERLRALQEAHRQRWAPPHQQSL